MMMMMMNSVLKEHTDVRELLNGLSERDWLGTCAFGDGGDGRNYWLCALPGERTPDGRLSETGRSEGNDRRTNGRAG